MIWEGLRQQVLPAGAGEVAALADQLCLARAAAAVRDQTLYAVDGPARAAGVRSAVLRLAHERGLLRIRGGRVGPAAGLGEIRPYAELLLAHPEVVARDPILFRWLARALDGLPSVLAGTVLAEEVLFPGGDFALAEAVYCDSAVLGYFVRLAVAIAAEIAPRRVLELGAGGGEAASRVLAVASAVEHYLATDVSPLLVERARQRLRDDPRAEVGLLDMDTPDWPAGPFDLVIATNVLHLARDPRAVMERIRARLRPGGVWVLGEVSAPEAGRCFPFVELTFGQLPSFWRDGSTSPLRAPAEWTTTLREAGFVDGRFLPLAFETSGSNYGGVYLLRAEGTVPGGRRAARPPSATVLCQTVGRRSG